MAPPIREDIVARVRLDGVPKLQADARAAAGSLDNLKRSAVSSTVPVGPAGSPSARLSNAEWAVQQERQLAAMRTQAQAIEAKATRQMEQQAAATAAARRRPAFGERGRAVANAAGAGRFAGLAAPFGGWGPLAAIGVGFTAVSQLDAAVKSIGVDQQLHAQTVAGIKSTGAAAHVTAAHIEDLANRYVKLYGVEHQTTQASENILLTFPSIRNEVGKSNKIFDQTSLAVANVAARMGTDAPQAALQLGKAINDPINGMTALRRIGVQFTTQQENQIKVLIASGNRLGAQKIILQELNREFGGSAKAAGTTFPAAMVKLQESWQDARNKLVLGILPDLTRATNWLAITLPGAIDTAVTALSVLDTDPSANALSRWLHRNWGGSVTGSIFDYTLKKSGKDALHDLGRHTLTHQLNVNGASTGSRADQQGLAERARQRAAVGGVMLDENGNPVKGMGQSWEDKSVVHVDWGMGDPLENRPIYLVATQGGQPLAQLVTKAQQKRTHAEGTGTSRR